MKKYLPIVLALIVIGGVLIYSGSKPQVQSSKQPIVLGAVISLTGPAASYGEYAKAGMELAVSEINKAGGVDGRKVRVIYEDDKTDPKSAVSAYQKLVSVDKADAIIGGLWDFTAQPLIPLALTNNITFISPSNFRIAGGFELNAQSFVMLTDFNKVIQKLSEYFKRDTVKKIAVVHFKSNFGKEIAKTITMIAQELGKEPVIDEAYTSINTNDFKTTIIKLKQQHVDTVFLDTVDMDSVNFLTQSKELGFTPTFITYVGFYDGFTDKNKSLLEGLTILNWETNSIEFTKRYKSMFHADPTKSANRSYDAVYVLTEAIAKSDTDAQVAAYIESHTFTTPNSKVTFLPTHQVASTPVEIDIYQGGNLIPYIR